MKRLLCVLSTTTLLACAAEFRQQQSGTLGPADPDAPESTPLRVPTALAPEPALSDEAAEERGPPEPVSRPHEHHHGSVEEREPSEPGSGAHEHHPGTEEKPAPREPDSPRPHEHHHHGHGGAQ